MLCLWKHGLQHIARALKTHGELLTAIATIVMTFYTMVLATVARRQFRLTHLFEMPRLALRPRQHNQMALKALAVCTLILAAASAIARDRDSRAFRLKGAIGFSYNVTVEHIFKDQHDCDLGDTGRLRIEREIAYFGAQNPQLTWANWPDQLKHAEELYSGPKLNPQLWPHDDHGMPKPPPDHAEADHDAYLYSWMPSIDLHIATFEAMPHSGWCIADVRFEVLAATHSDTVHLKGTGLAVTSSVVDVWGPRVYHMRTTEKDLVSDICEQLREWLKDLVIDWTAVQKEAPPAYPVQ
jgi:hypothetical protein